jgi:L-lactate dehydrogenase complex protein LldG
MTSARDAILRRIQNALVDVPASEQLDDCRVERGYHQSSTESREELVGRFVERVSDYGATLRHVTDETLPGAIAEAVTTRGVRRLVVPTDLPDAWTARLDGIELLRDGPGNERSVDALDTSDGALTACAVAIAQSGSIVLDGGSAQGRRAITLVPDYHLCVVRADQIVGIVPEAITALAGAALPHTRRPMTFISGPSATVDIEFQRVQGVHGPRTLDILLVG